MACTVKITGTGSSTYCYVTINGTKYTSAATLTVEEGTVVTCGVRAYKSTAEIYVNGQVVKSSTSNTTITYEHTLSNDATIEMNYSSGAATYAVKITEEIPSEPSDPGDIHNTLISGTAREIESGTVLIGDVGQEIESGLVLANGVAREISFGPSTYTLTIASEGSENNLYLRIPGSTGDKYYSPVTMEFEAGTEIYCYSRYSSTAQYLNGELVYNKLGGYTYTLTGNAVFNFSVNSGVAVVRVTME